MTITEFFHCNLYSMYKDCLRIKVNLLLTVDVMLNESISNFDRLSFTVSEIRQLKRRKSPIRTYRRIT